MNTPLHFPITEVAPLLPHSGRMVLIDCITAYSNEHIIAQTQIRPNHILLVNGKLPCSACIEIMAQAVGAWSGCQAHEAGEAVRLGFLLGTRKLELFADNVEIGTKLEIRAQLSMQDATGMGVFDCTVWALNMPSEKHEQPILLAQASLNVYSPKEAIHAV